MTCLVHGICRIPRSAGSRAVTQSSPSTLHMTGQYLIKELLETICKLPKKKKLKSEQRNSKENARNDNKKSTVARMVVKSAHILKLMKMLS